MQPDSYANATSNANAAAPLAILVIVATAIGLWAPQLDGGMSLISDSSDWAYLFVGSLAALLVVGGFVAKTSAVRAGLVVGASVALAGYFALIGSASMLLVTLLDRSPGAGMVAAWAVVVISVVALFTLLPSTADPRRVESGAVPFGVIAALASAVAFMVPPPDSFESFTDRNFEHGSGWSTHVSDGSPWTTHDVAGYPPPTSDDDRPPPPPSQPSDGASPDGAPA